MTQFRATTMDIAYSRRSFLAGAAAASVSLIHSAAIAQGRLEAALTIGLQSYSLGEPDVHKTIRMAGSLGFRAIEISARHLPVNSSPAQIAQVKSELAESAMRVTGHGVNRFSSDHEANRKTFEFAHQLGVPNLAANPTADAFDSLDALVEEYGIRIAIHNHGPMASYDKVIDTLHAVRDRHPSIGACADLGHYIRSGEDPVLAIRLLAGRLFGVHLKDYVKANAQTRESVILGRGMLDMEGVFKALKQIRFPADGALSIEYESESPTRIEDVMACLAAARNAAQR